MAVQERSVLLIEPDEGVRTALTSMFRNMGWQVWAFACGERFEDEIKLHHPAVVISESALPDLAADSVLKTSRSHQIPVIFLGHGREVQQAVDLMREGAADFLEKPFPQSRLIKLMEHITNPPAGLQ